MNPYLEQEDVWQDFHDRMIPAIGDVISPQVSPHFFVKIQEHLYVRELPADKRIRIGSGDVTLAAAPKHGISGTGVVAFSAPHEIILPQVEFDNETFLEIHDRKKREVVCVIELLSPANKKAGADREQYLAKRRNVLYSWVHFVEIDLLRGWARMPGKNAPKSDYCVMVSRYNERPLAGYWPIDLRDPLPVIPIPLRKPVPEARLDLQSVLHQVYDRAFYKDHIYEGSPTPALRGKDLAWARRLIAP
jgi:hypothetical protein